MGHFPNMLTACEGRGHDTLSMFDENLASTLHKTCSADADDEGLHLVWAAQTVRRNV